MKKKTLMVLALVAIMLMPACKKQNSVSTDSDNSEETTSNVLIANFNLCEKILGKNADEVTKIVKNENEGWSGDNGSFSIEVHGNDYDGHYLCYYLGVDYGETNKAYTVTFELSHDSCNAPYSNSDYKSLLDKLGGSYTLNNITKCDFNYASYGTKYEPGSYDEITDYNEFKNNIDAISKANYSYIRWASEDLESDIHFHRSEYGFRIIIGNYYYKNN